MPQRLYQLIEQAAQRTPDAVALLWRDETLLYRELLLRIEAFAGALQALGVQRGERIGVYLPKQFETVVALFGSNRADAVFIPINPQLKPEQVRHVLDNAGASLLVTSAQRAGQLAEELPRVGALRGLILTDSAVESTLPAWQWNELPDAPPRPAQTIDIDLAALLYTSGSTGLPKGVMLSQRNLICGAQSVAQYLQNEATDRLLAALPLSFDYGLSQLTTAFCVGASVVLLDYLLPRDVVRAVARYSVTGLAGVPPLWQQLAGVDWPAESRCLRYFTNSGGRLPVGTLARLRQCQPRATPYLMYGLTEAFRSTWLPPEWLERKPGSIGIAIPNAEVLVVREDGSICADNEEGELVHRGSLVALGYWADETRTRERFRPLPATAGRPVADERAVWSGDWVYRDEDGFLFFVGRRDEQIKCSGYRLSPDEIEQEILASALVDEVVITAADHPSLGQAPIAVLKGDPQVQIALQQWLKARLPGYMQPQAWLWYEQLPRNANGKYDRSLLRQALQRQFQPD